MAFRRRGRRWSALLPDPAPHALGGQGKLVHVHARVGERADDRRGHRREGSLAAPLRAVGPRAVGVLDDDRAHRARKVADPRDPVFEQAVVEQLAVGEAHLLEERVADALQRRALVLTLDQLRVDRAPDVGDGRRAQHADDARVRVDLDLGAGDAHLPEVRALRVGAGVASARADLAALDDLAPAKAEALRDQVGVGDLLGAERRMAVRELDQIGVDVPELARGLAQARGDVLGGALHGQPGDRGRAARAGRAVIGREARIGAVDADEVAREAQLLGGDLRHHGARALAHLRRPDVDVRRAVRAQAHRRARDRVRARGEQPHADAAADPGTARLIPTDRGGSRLNISDEIGVQRLPGAVRADGLAREDEAAAAQLERVDPGAARDLVQLGLADPLQVRRAERAVGPRRGRVAVHAVALHVDGIEAIGPGSGVGAGRDDARAVVGVGAGVHLEAHLAREQRAVGRRARAHPRAHAVAARGDHRLLDAVDDPHRPPRLARQRDGQRLHLRVGLRSEAAAEVGDDDPHGADRHPEEVRDLGLHEERVLAVGPQRDPVTVMVRDRRVRLHRVLVDRGEGVGALDHDRRPRGRLLEIPGVDQMAVADVAAALAELAEAVEEPDLRAALVQRRRLRRERLLDRAEHRQQLVGDLDRAHRRLRRRLVRGGDGSHRLAREAHAVDRDDRAILDRMAVIGLDVVEVGGGEDRGHPLHRERRGGVDGEDPRMRVRAAQDLAVEHPRHLHVTDVLGLAAQLLGGVLARARDADLEPPDALLDGHGPIPARSRAASRIERYPVQRQTDPSRPWMMSSSVRSSPASRRLFSVSSSPGVQ